MTSLHRLADEERSAAPLILGALSSLFTRLHAEDITYCHWKSNEHLAASMMGETDLDLLVDRADVVPLARILGELDFKRFTAVGLRAYPGVEDYLGFDADTGRLIHLHVHYQLTLGEKHLKGFRLPWEALALKTRRLDDEEQVSVIDPHLEVVLLLVRAALKVRTRDRLLTRQAGACFGAGALRELRWLAERVQPDRLLELARTLLGPAAAPLVVAMVAAPPPSVRQLLALRRCAEPTLGEYRIYGAASARWRRWAREAAVLAHRAGRSRRGPTPSRRVVPFGGAIVAFVGSDGSGKSTLVREITRWLGWKVDAIPAYMGSGQGTASLPRWLLQRFAPLTRRSPSVSQPAAGTHDGAANAIRDAASPRVGRKRLDSIRATLRRFGAVLWVVARSRERRESLRCAQRARDLGMIVICDRYPQSQFVGFNDGPRFGEYLQHPSWLIRYAARLELAEMRVVALHTPDLVIKLHVTPDVAARRRPEHAPADLRRKIEAVKLLSFPSTTRVVDIDGNRPFDDVLLEAKRIVWESI